MEWIKEKGLRYYDLNGINPETNPGTYHFKRGLAGKKGIDVEFLGKYQVVDNPISALIVNGGELLVSKYKKILQKGRSLRNSSKAIAVK
jgi:lipid II:glycine glycyltransferase (peptidoglycan interpeptide bridge formation enzyme)